MQLVYPIGARYLQGQGTVFHVKDILSFIYSDSLQTKSCK